MQGIVFGISIELYTRGYQAGFGLKGPERSLWFINIVVVVVMVFKQRRRYLDELRMSGTRARWS